MLTPIANRIQERLDALGLSARAASLAATGSDGTIRMILTGESVDPRWTTLVKLAKVLETTPEWLRTGEANAQIIGGDSDVALLGAARVPRLHEGHASIPILGTAMGSIIKEGVEGFRFEGAEIGYTARPAALLNVPEAYAVYVIGDSMWPLHPPGERRLINPRRPTAPGNSVVVITQHWEDDPGQAYIKLLRRRTQSTILLEQLNPRLELEIPTKYVKAVHYVFTYDDLLGT